MKTFSAQDVAEILRKYCFLPRGLRDICKAYDVVGFQHPEAGETFIAPTGLVFTATIGDRIHGPHIIVQLRKKPTEYVYHFVGVRIPRHGDWFWSDDRWVQAGDGIYTLNRPVFTRQEVPDADEPF